MLLENQTAQRQSRRSPQIFTDLPSVELEIMRGRVRQRLRPVAGPVFLIGTASHCDLVLGDPRFPAVHSYLLVTRRGVTLRHLGQPPQPVVEGQRFEAVQLSDGQQITLEPFQFQVHIRPAGEAAAQPVPTQRLRIHGGDDSCADATGPPGAHLPSQQGWN